MLVWIKIFKPLDLINLEQKINWQFNESLTFSGVIYNVLKSIPVIYSPSEIKYSPIVLKLEGASLTGKTSALNDTTVASIPPPSVPPSSLTVIVIKEDPKVGLKWNKELSKWFLNMFF